MTHYIPNSIQELTVSYLPIAERNAILKDPENAPLVPLFSKAVSNEYLEAKRIPGSIYAKASSKMRGLTQEEVSRKIDFLISQSKHLFTEAERAETGIDRLDEMTYTQKTLLADIIAEKRAKALISFFEGVVVSQIPAAAEFYQNVPEVFSNRSLAAQIREWLNANSDQLNVVERFDDKFLKSVPREIILFSSLDNILIFKILCQSAKTGNFETFHAIMRSRPDWIAFHGLEIPFKRAIEEGQSEIVRAIINSPEFDDIADRFVFDGLEIASRDGHFEIVQEILNSARAPEIPQARLNYSLFMALQNRFPNIVRELLNAGRPDSNTIGTLTLGALYHSDEESIQLLLPLNHFRELSLRLSACLFLLAAIRGKPQVCRELINSPSLFVPVGLLTALICIYNIWD